MKLFIGLTLTVLTAVICFPGSGRSAVDFSIEMDKPVVYFAGGDRVTLKIALDADEAPSGVLRPPLNLALVLDKSGSMGGRKILDARQAAIEVVKRLSPRDTFSLVVFDTEPRVLIPAHRLIDPAAAISIIRGIGSGGSTALYGGLNLGASEIRKGEGGGAIPRIVLLSDGLANVGPRSAADLSRLGRALAGEGITVTTVGLGLDYNEDLMTALASASDGNCYFARESRELPRIFAEELGDATTLAARDLTVRIEFPENVTPISILGRTGRVEGQAVEVKLNNLYSSGEKYVLVEAEVAAGKPGRKISLARVNLDYDDLYAGGRRQGAKSVSIRYSDKPEEVEANLNSKVIKVTTLTKVSEAKEKAVELADRGDYRAAAAVMAANQSRIEDAVTVCGAAPELVAEEERCREYKVTIESDKGLCRHSRKRIMNEAYIQLNQQRYESR